jgi:Bax protein
VLTEDPHASEEANGAQWTLAVPALLCAMILCAGVLGRARPQLEAELGESEVAAPRAAAPLAPIRLFLFDPAPASQLVRLLDAAWALPRAREAVPNVAPQRLPEDMDRLDVDAKKRLFLRAVAPHVLAENRRIRALRRRLVELRQQLVEGAVPDEDELAFLGRVALEYRVEVGEDDLQRLGAEALMDALLDRVDVVPPSLALSQAAIESAWGSSRFVRLGNAVFGQWVFSADKGMAPLFRPEGADYSVARFTDLAEAVAAYVRNLNTLWAYEDFRMRRRRMRAAGAVLDAHALAEGLRLYSERRDAYVEEVRRVMSNNRLGRFDGRRLTPASAAVWHQVLADAGARPMAMRPVLLPE